MRLVDEVSHEIFIHFWTPHPGYGRFSGASKVVMFIQRLIVENFPIHLGQRF